MCRPPCRALLAGLFLIVVAGSASSATAAGPGAVDILFMVDNSSSMDGMQRKLAQQMRAFVSAATS
jgi:hypothetical protein